jgi:hypothetical protein
MAEGRLITFTVKSINGESYTLRMPCNSKLRQLLEKIRELNGNKYSVDIIRLIHAGKDICGKKDENQEMTLEELHIVTNCTLILVLRLIGGQNQSHS